MIINNDDTSDGEAHTVFKVFYYWIWSDQSDLRRPSCWTTTSLSVHEQWRFAPDIVGVLIIIIIVWMNTEEMRVRDGNFKVAQENDGKTWKIGVV